MSYCVISSSSDDRRTSHTLPSRIQFSHAGLSNSQHCTTSIDGQRSSWGDIPSLHLRLLALDLLATRRNGSIPARSTTAMRLWLASLLRRHVRGVQ